MNRNPRPAYSGRMHTAAQVLAEALRGKLISAAATPMTRERGTEEAAIRAYFKALMERGSDGLAVGVHTGRGDHLGLDQRVDLVRIASEVSPLVITAVSEQRPTGASRQWPRLAAQAGADALLLFRAQDSTPSQTLARCDELWQQTSLPIIAFDLYTRPYDAGHLALLLQHPAVAAFKPARLYDAIASQDATAAAVRQGLTVLTGEDRMLGASLTWGASGALAGIAAACTEVTAAVVRAHHDGAAPEFLAASRALDRLAAATFREPWDGYVQRMLWIAEDEGLIPACMANDPFRPANLSDGERAEVVSTARSARAEVALP